VKGKAAVGTHSLRQPVLAGGFQGTAVVLRSPVLEASAAETTWVLLSSQPSNPARDAGDSCPDGGGRLNAWFASFLQCALD
jgi:hypothetical protein